MARAAQLWSQEGVGDGGRRYSAFISYSHADGAFAKRLHRALEAYRLPHRALVRADGGALSGARLKPVFRDIDELTAAHDLTTAVREAIASSEHLIVVCTPNAAASPWVAKEIALFRELHGDAGILAVLAQGDPKQAFPPALRGAGEDLEPLAADFRGDGSSRHLALLKLVAALAGVRLDELMQRDAQRRMQNLLVGAAGAVAGVAVVAVLSVAALNARAEANLQRQKAGGLGAFMANDLRKGLQSSGRLDLQMAADKAALDYYRGQDLSHLPPDALAQRAKALHAAGEDNEKHGDLPTAQAQFEEARRTTGALLAAKPNDAQRIFDHAQSEYWVGFVNWRKGDAAAAKAGFEAYAKLAERLVHTDPKNDAWVMETVYAANGEGMLALRQNGDPKRAEPYYQRSVALLKTIAERKPTDRSTLISLANAYAWLADCQRLQGDAADALKSREAQRTVLLAILAMKPRDVGGQEGMLSHDLGVARIEMQQGDLRRAVAHLELGRQDALALQKDDPENADFAKQARMFELFKVRAWIAMPPRFRPRAAQIATVLGDCRPAAARLANQEISDFCNVLLARVRTDAGDQTGAAAAMAGVQDHLRKQHDVLTAHWGLNLPEETRTLQVAYSGGTK